MESDFLRPWLSLDPWQQEYVECEDNCFLLCGRQVGKSTAASIKAVELAVNHYAPGEDILIIALTERQAYNLFSKALSYAMARYPNEICGGAKKPTKHEINFKSGVKIMCHPTGLMGEGLRGFTVKKIIADEAARMNDEVFVAILPMLAVTKGTIDLLSTPHGKLGFFYEASKREDFKKFYVSAEDCPRTDREHLENAKKTMTKLQYAQEYLAQFLDQLRRFFPEELIKAVCTLDRSPRIKGHEYYLGSDIARMGEDLTTFEIIDATYEGQYIQVENILYYKNFLTEIADQILNLDRTYDFKEIGIDDRGVGAGVLDILLRTDVKNKIQGLDNAKRALNRDENRFAKLMKEDMYLNLRAFMERGELKLLNDDELIASLRSVQCEYQIKENKKTQFSVYGSDTHIAEGLIRAAWFLKSKTLNIGIDFI